MSNSNGTALKAGSWYVFSNFLIKGVGILTTPIITRLLSPGDFGMYNTYKSTLLIFSIIGTLNVISSVHIAYQDFDKKEFDGYVSSVVSLSTIAVSIFYLLIKLTGNFVPDMLGMPMYLFDFMYFNIIFMNAFDILQSKHRAEMKYRSFVILSILVAIISPLLSIFLISIMDTNQFIGYILGTQLPIILAGVLIFFKIFKEGKTIYKKEYWKYVLLLSVPLIPHALSNNLLSQFDRILINSFRGEVEVGLYSLAYSYSAVLTTIWNSLNQAWAPWFYGKMREHTYRDVTVAIKPYTILFSAAFLGMVAIGPEALKIFGPAEYQDGVWVIAPVLLGLFFQFVYSLYVNVEIYYKKTKQISIGTLSAAALNIVLNLIFIPKFGFIGAAYTTLVGYLFLFAVHYTMANKLMDADIFNNKFIIKWSALMIVMTAIFVVFTNHLLIRWIIYIVFALIIFLHYRKPIIDGAKTFMASRRK